MLENSKYVLRTDEPLVWRDFFDMGTRIFIFFLPIMSLFLERHVFVKRIAPEFYPFISEVKDLLLRPFISLMICFRPNR